MENTSKMVNQLQVLWRETRCQITIKEESVIKDMFRQHLKKFLFASYWCTQRIIGFFTIMRYDIDIDRLS